MAPVQEQRPVKLEQRPCGRERRSHARYQFPGAVLDFGFPGPLGEHRVQPLKDLSLGGIAFYFPRGCCLEKVRVGQVLHAIALKVLDLVIHLDMLVMRVAETNDGRMVCGGLAYWKTLEDFEQVKALTRWAEQGRPLP